MDDSTFATFEVKCRASANWMGYGRDSDIMSAWSVGGLLFYRQHGEVDWVVDGGGGGGNTHYLHVIPHAS